MVYARKWKNKPKSHWIHLSETLRDFIIAGNANVYVVGKENLLESQADGHYNNPDRSDDNEISAC